MLLKVPSPTVTATEAMYDASGLAGLCWKNIYWLRIVCIMLVDRFPDWVMVMEVGESDTVMSGDMIGVLPH